MSIQEFYNTTGGNYEDIMRRFRDEERIIKYLSKFTEDQSFAQLGRAMEEGNFETAFRAAHSLKGICMNLGLTRLQVSSSALTENLRERKAEDETRILFEKTMRDYSETLINLQELLNS